MHFEPDSTFWHCRIVFGGAVTYYSYDKTFSEIKEQVIIPYNHKKTIYIDSGVISDISRITNIQIVQSKVDTKTYRSNNLKIEMFEWFLNLGKDVTYLLLSDTKNTHNEQDAHQPLTSQPLKKNIFIIHGHDEALKSQVALFLKNQELSYTILADKPGGGKTIIEKFEYYSAECSFAISLWTPDDLGQKMGDDQLQKRARQNVIFETGYFCGRLGRSKVAVLYSDKVEIPSDYYGVSYISTKDTDWKNKLVDEMNEAGFSLDKNKI